MTSLSFAGISVVGEASEPQPASATIAVTYSGYHLLVVHEYSSLVKDNPNGDGIESLNFGVGGYRWTLQWYPNGYEPEDNGYMSFYLFLDQGNVVDPVLIQYEFSFVAHQVQTIHQVRTVPQARTVRRFRPNIRTNNQSLLERSEGKHKFCSRDAYRLLCLNKREIFEKSNYLKNDSFTVRCDIIINKDANINEASYSRLSLIRNMLPAADIRQDLSDLLRSGIGTDVTFQVGGGTFMVHRCVLAARSAVFKAQLFGPMEEGTTTSVVHIRDMEEQVFKLLLDFIYSDSVPEVDNTEEKEIVWQHLLEAADRYDLPRLTVMCEQELCSYIKTSTVATILALAEQHHCRMLKEACLDFLNSPANLQEVMALDGLDHLVSSCPSVLKDVIRKLNTRGSGAAAVPVLEVPKSDMQLDFSCLFESKERTDVTFQVGGEAICAHRCLLAARSTVFRAEFFGPRKDTDSDVIRIDDMEARVFKLLLTFIYTDTVPMMKKRKQEEREEGDADGMWQQLLAAADRYGVQGLRLVCERRLGRDINTNTVATILALAEQYHCQRLKEECLEFLDFPAHLKQVMAAGGLDHLKSICPSVLVDLVAKLAGIYA